MEARKGTDVSDVARWWWWLAQETYQRAVVTRWWFVGGGGWQMEGRKAPRSHRGTLVVVVGRWRRNIGGGWQMEVRNGRDSLLLVVVVVVGWISLVTAQAPTAASETWISKGSLSSRAVELG
jgi:hypothetical protein